MSPPPILLLRDDRFLEHDVGAGHSECPARLEAIHAELDARPLRRADGSAAVATATPRPATREQLLGVHTAAHVDAVAATAGRARVAFDDDTFTSPRSYEAALLAAGAVVDAVEAVASGAANGAFAAVRPPGHHATAERAMGFCLFNNVAVAAEHARRSLGLARVAVLDPDVHHGNGTQDIFWERDDVLYVSSHRFPFYPGTGAANEVGAGDGEGATLNLPLQPGDGDAELLSAWRDGAGPRIERFAPELILVSAGFDAAEGDPLGGLAVTTPGYAALAALFLEWSAQHCPGRLVFALEGGYAPPTLARNVHATLSVLAGAAAGVQAAGADGEAAS